MSNVNRSVQDEILSYVDEHEDNGEEDYAGGTSPERLTLPDQAPVVEIVQALTVAVANALELDRKRAAERQKGYLENQAAGYVSFQRYNLAANQPVQIVREKLFRSNALIVVYDGTVSVGLHAGVSPLGTDTVAIVGAAAGSSREIKTIQALWAVSSTPCTLDVQEEYGG